VADLFRDKVLITGAARFIGRHIMRRLAGDGFIPIPVYPDRAKFRESYSSFDGDSLE